MIKLAVIGTNWITDQFIEGALKTGLYELTAVYSRRLESAKSFAEKYGNVQLFDDLATLGGSVDVDAVYIASPNSFHAPQAIELMKAGKHVICEKPVASNYTQAQAMYRAAKENNVVLFEAFITPHLPNFSVLKNALKEIGALRKATISYCQYSSRYQKYLHGENPNTFNPEFSNGSVMDIGFYCVGAAIELFGEPESIQAQAHMLNSGVDGCGSVIFGYPGFDVVIGHSKISDSYVPSEFQGEDAALMVDMISICNSVTKKVRGGESADISVPQDDNRMRYEAAEAARQISENKMVSQQSERSLIVAKVLTEIRRQTGVVFPADDAVSAAG
ncbi:Gfo/Idh/MocA family protein [Vibrio paucivorans]